MQIVSEEGFAIITTITELASIAGPFIGMDFGLKKIGLAISDKSLIVASPYQTYHRKGVESDAIYLSDLIQRLKVNLIVTGLPIDLEHKIEIPLYKNMCKLLKKLYGLHKLPVFMQDERFSTKQSIGILKDLGFNRKKSLELEDKIAASYILQDVLELLK